MKKIAKSITLVLGLSVLIYIVYITISLFTYTSSWSRGLLGQDDIEAIFARDYEVLEMITEYLVESSYDDIWIGDSMNKGVAYTRNGAKVYISDQEIVQLIEVLKSRNYQSIDKRSITISFSIGGIKDKDRGIVYCQCIEDIEIDFLTKIVKLDIDNWYYFEADYDEWRIINQKKKSN